MQKIRAQQIALNTTGEILEFANRGTASHPTTIYFKVLSGIALFGADSAGALAPVTVEDGWVPFLVTVQEFYAKSQAGTADLRIWEA